MDEQPFQLLKETKVPIAATKTHGERVDYKYERNGSASFFMFCEPLVGFRQATARAQRSKADWAFEVAHRLDTNYAACDKITLVMDNLNTHTKGAFYEAFEPALARAYIQRIDFSYTPNLDEPEPKAQHSTQRVPDEGFTEYTKVFQGEMALLCVLCEPLRREPSGCCVPIFCGLYKLFTL